MNPKSPVKIYQLISRISMWTGDVVKLDPNRSNEHEQTEMNGLL